MRNLKALVFVALLVCAGWVTLGLLLLPGWVVLAVLIVLAAGLVGTVASQP